MYVFDFGLGICVLTEGLPIQVGFMMYIGVRGPHCTVRLVCRLTSPGARETSLCNKLHKSTLNWLESNRSRTLMTLIKKVLCTAAVSPVVSKAVQSITC